MRLSPFLLNCTTRECIYECVSVYENASLCWPVRISFNTEVSLRICRWLHNIIYTSSWLFVWFVRIGANVSGICVYIGVADVVRENELITIVTSPPGLFRYSIREYFIRVRIFYAVSPDGFLLWNKSSFSPIYVERKRKRERLLFFNRIFLLYFFLSK